MAREIAPRQTDPLTDIGASCQARRLKAIYSLNQMWIALGRAMAINSRLVYLVLIGYFSMFLIMGALSAFASFGGPQASPEELRAISNEKDENIRRMFFETPFTNAQQRYTKLGEICISSFQIIIGAIIGFLSAIGSLALGNRPTNDTTPNVQVNPLPPNQPPAGGTEAAARVTPAA